MNRVSPESMQPAVLFVCAKNGGKSQMAAGLMRFEAGNEILVMSAGTHPGSSINSLSADVLLEPGIDITAEHPKLLTETDMKAAGLVVILGTEAEVPDVEGVTVERWETDEPSLRGIDGRERMKLVRDDIHLRVRGLKDRLLNTQ